jgi:hypothetical protein
VKAVVSSQAKKVIDDVDEFLDGVFAPLQAWIPRLEEQLTLAIRNGKISGAQLAALTEADAHEILKSQTRPLYGAGYCATDLVVSEGNPLAWWQGPERSLLASSTFGPGQAAIDLQRLEWFRVPSETFQRHIAGPFVDYLCSNEITLTASIPVFINQVFSGVACADVLVASLEEFLLPPIVALGGATLINAHGRVVVSASQDFETGDRFEGVGSDGSLTGIGEGSEVLHSSRYPFALIVPTY